METKYIIWGVGGVVALIILILGISAVIYIATRDHAEDVDTSALIDKTYDALYKKLDATDYPEQGNLLTAPGNETSCKMACSSLAKCAGFVTDGTTCWFKDNTVATPSYNEKMKYFYNTETAPSAPATAPTPAPAPTYATLASTDYAGQGDIASHTGATCQTICDNTPNCTGFVTNGTNCWFKDNTVKTPSYNEGLTYYYKGTAPTPAATKPVAGISGRYIKLVRPTVGCLNLGEISITSSATGPNIAGTAVITKSSSYGSDTYPVRNLNDSNAGTFVHTSCADAPWILIDLQSVVPIYSVVLTNRKDCCQSRATGLIMSILDASRNPVYVANPLKDQSGSTTPSDTTAGGPYMVYTWTPPNKDAVGSQPIAYAH